MSPWHRHGVDLQLETTVLRSSAKVHFFVMSTGALELTHSNSSSSVLTRAVSLADATVASSSSPLGKIKRRTPSVRPGLLNKGRFTGELERRKDLHDLEEKTKFVSLIVAIIALFGLTVQIIGTEVLVVKRNLPSFSSCWCFTFGLGLVHWLYARVGRFVSISICADHLPPTVRVAPQAVF